MRRRDRLSVWLVLLCLGTVTGARAAGPASKPLAEAASEPPIELPKFEVVDRRLLPQPESWHYAEIPGFEILSNISERETRRFARDFLLLQDVIRMIMPELTRGRGEVPTAVVLCGRGKGVNDFLPVERREDAFSANSLFFESPERTAIVVDFALSDLLINNDTIIEADPYRSFYSEYFRFLIRRKLGRGAPPWLEEGLVRLFAGIDFNKKWVTFALIGDGFGGEKTGDFNRMLARRRIMPFGEMLTHTKRGHDTIWATQCYAFVHMCLYSMGNKYRKPFIEYVSQLGDEPPTEALFQKCFHKTYNQMAVELRGYLQFTAHTYIQFQAKKGRQLPEPAAVALRDATDAEVGRIKGEVFRLGGRDAAARMELIAPYIRGERDPRLLAALGLDERAAGHDDRARKFLEAAARAHAVRPRAYLELARLRYTEALVQAGNGKLNATQVDFVLGPLNTARTQPPPLAEVYGMMAEVRAHAAAAPTREQIDEVVQGVRLFPRDVPLLWQAVMLASERGFPDDAWSLAEHGIKISAPHSPERDRFELLAAALRRDAPSASPAVVQPAPTNQP